MCELTPSRLDDFSDIDTYCIKKIFLGERGAFWGGGGGGKELLPLKYPR